jgi:hypothetical protein
LKFVVVWLTVLAKALKRMILIWLKFVAVADCARIGPEETNSKVVKFEGLTVDRPLLLYVVRIGRGEGHYLYISA